MSRIELFALIPSLMSAIAAIAAAIAAFVALRISRKAHSLNESSVLAVHHNSAVLELSSGIDTLHKSTRNLSDFSYRLWADWASQIEAKDIRSNGGTNPRPLRHVLTNGSEMLAEHGKHHRRPYRYTQNAMFSIIRDGVTGVNDSEYNALLRKADGSYSDFEGVFGVPSQNESISNSDAFRWVCYQLARRVEEKDWSKIWKDAWEPDGWISKYRTEFSNVKPVLKEVLSSLRAEKTKVAHSAFPLESNPSLNKKYQTLFYALEVLLENGDLSILEHYQDAKFCEDIPQLVLYSMGMAYFVAQVLGEVTSGEARGDF